MGALASLPGPKHVRLTVSPDFNQHHTVWSRVILRVPRRPCWSVGRAAPQALRARRLRSLDNLGLICFYI